MLGALARASPGDINEPVLYWPVLVKIDRALGKLGEAAGVERDQLDQYRVPLQKRLAEIRASAEQTHVPEGRRKLIDDAVAKALDDYPPELRTRAAEAFARLGSRDL